MDIVRPHYSDRLLKRLLHGIGVLLGAAAMTLAFFLVLPLMQIISKPPATDLILQSADIALPPPPPPLEEPEPEKEPEPEDEPPELVEEAPPLDLLQLELALNPAGEGAGQLGDIASQLQPLSASHTDVDALFSLADLDQKPRPVYQPGPHLNHQIRQKAPGTVYMIFIVDERGRVENPIVQQSSDPVFEQPALAAVKQWKFEPGKRNGQPVRFRMRVPITFPKG
jgi:periplasmic protein TonB